ncbi:MAG: hypothetical protein NTU83_11415 [Candidatus Hydrogenedentes bacterium]|nr:hypothetical protein [Candidatus Hydrogenedentota bacterium]
MSGLPSNRWRAAISVAANVLCGAWLIGGSLFFFFRFSMVFYAANKGAVDSALERLLGHP